MFAYLKDDSDASIEKNKDLLQQCVAFLDGMLDPELLETRAVMLFLSELVNYIQVVGHSEPGIGMSAWLAITIR